MKTSTRVLIGGIAAGALVATYAAVAATSQTAPAARATFGTPVVADFFHPGYEPDLAIARAGAYKGSTFASVPNGFSTTMSYIWRSDDNRRRPDAAGPGERTTTGQRPAARERMTTGRRPRRDPGRRPAMGGRQPASWRRTVLALPISVPSRPITRATRMPSPE